jgi:hypothetical protein
VRQQAPLTPRRRRLRTLSSLLKAGRAPTRRQTTRARSGRPAALYHHPRLEGNTISLMNAAAIVGLLYFVVGKRDVWARGE